MNFFHAVNAAVAVPTTAPSGIELVGVTEVDVLNTRYPIFVPYHASAQVGDLVVAIVCTDNGASSQYLNAATGYTIAEQRASSQADVEFMVAWKFLDASDLMAGSALFYNDTSFLQAHGYGVHLRGAHASPIDGIVSTISGSGTTTNINPVTPTYDDGFVLAHIAFDGGDGEPFSVSTSGWTKFGDFEVDSGGSGLSGCLVTKNTLSVGGVSTGTLTLISQVSDGKYAFQLVVRAA